MNIKINGKSETIEEAKNIGEVILKKGLSPDRIVVEHNLQIVAKEEWPKTILNEGDNIEIVSFVGGG